MKKITNILMSTALLLAFTACSDDNDDPVIINEEEVITTINVVLSSPSSTVTLSSVDLDGDGPNAPVVSVSGALSANETYTGSISFLNETESPAEDITEEVAEESDEHQVFYTFGSGISNVTATDTDNNGNPLGLAFTLETSGTTGNTSLGFTLRHEPTKPNTGLNSAGGETDIEVNFNVAVE